MQNPPLTSSARPRAAAGLALCALLLAAGAASAQRADHHPAWAAVRFPELTTRPARGPIAIDGVLDDAGWEGLTPALNFVEHQPGDQTRKSPLHAGFALVHQFDNHPD